MGNGPGSTWHMAEFWALSLLKLNGFIGVMLKDFIRNQIAYGFILVCVMVGNLSFMFILLLIYKQLPKLLYN